MGFLRELFDPSEETLAAREKRRKERERQWEIERNLIHFMDMSEFPEKNVRLCDNTSGDLKTSDKWFKTFDPKKVTCPRCKNEMTKTGILEWKPVQPKSKPNKETKS